MSPGPNPSTLPASYTIHNKLETIDNASKGYASNNNTLETKQQQFGWHLPGKTQGDYICLALQEIKDGTL